MAVWCTAPAVGSSCKFTITIESTTSVPCSNVCPEAQEPAVAPAPATSANGIALTGYTVAGTGAFATTTFEYTKAGPLTDFVIGTCVAAGLLNAETLGYHAPSGLYGLRFGSDAATFTITFSGVRD